MADFLSALGSLANTGASIYKTTRENRQQPAATQFRTADQTQGFQSYLTKNPILIYLGAGIVLLVIVLTLRR